MVTYVLQYTYKWISAVQFGTHGSDITVTHQESFSMVAAGVIEISYGFQAKAHSETQIVNIFKLFKVLKLLQGAFDHVNHHYLLPSLNSAIKTVVHKTSLFAPVYAGDGQGFVCTVITMSISFESAFLSCLMLHLKSTSP